jgi:hypothetical protein
MQTSKILGVTRHNPNAALAEQVLEGLSLLNLSADHGVLIRELNEITKNPTASIDLSNHVERAKAPDGYGEVIRIRGNLLELTDTVIITNISSYTSKDTTKTVAKAGTAIEVYASFLKTCKSNHIPYPKELEDLFLDAKNELVNKINKNIATTPMSELENMGYTIEDDSLLYRICCNAMIINVGNILFDQIEYIEIKA